jgi:Cu/Ag efflux protein CusF
MSSIIRSSLVASWIVIMIVAAVAQRVTAHEAAALNEEYVVGLAGDSMTAKPATETLCGIVDSVDQGHDTLRVRLSPGNNIEDFKVQDGLIFNAVRYGDTVELTVERTNGEQTIVGLRKD